MWKKDTYTGEEPFIFENKDGHIKKIAMYWSREDIEDVAEYLGETLTDEDIDEILIKLLDRFDAKLGINRLIIEAYRQEQER
jgi:hypothetical protein